jgi:energy-coupling factor transporter ATP-binding protein EcfA2
MNEKFLQELAGRFYEEMQSSDELQDHIQEHLRRAQRAQKLLTLGKIPELREDELRELFFDSDAFSFWSNKEWEFNNRLQKYGLDGLRQVILELITRAERGLTSEDLNQVWDMRGLGTLLSTELIAYRYPDRYWTYNASVTLAAFNILGEDIKSSMPHGQKSDAYMYFAIEPLLDQVQEALKKAGFSSVGYLLTDIFIWWIKTYVPPPQTMEDKVIPNVEPDEIKKALQAFDSQKRGSPEWIAWESKENYRYAIAWKGRLYPVKEIVRMATRADDFTSSQARDYLEDKGFTISLLEREAPPSPPIQIGDLIFRSLKSRGLHFKPWQVATFYTALQTKGFVILSGISGTGKTKLAQHIASLLPRPTKVLQPSEDQIQITIQPYMLKYNRLIIPKAGTRFFDPPGPGETFEVRTRFNGQSETCRLNHAKYTNTDYVQLFLRGKARSWFVSTMQEGDLLFLEPELDSEGNLTGFKLIDSKSNTGNSDNQKSKRTENWTFIPVRPDWRDSKSLLGYYNPLTGSYEWTPFLRFLLKAIQSFRDNDRVAWFIILDEMNLARVEYYFADLLSVLESGRDESGWTREPLRFIYPADAEGDLPPSELKLPPNLYIIGTVNVDETTYAFSPKVLDRAFTLELTEADFSHYLLDEDLEEFILDERLRQQIFDSFTFSGEYAHVDKQRIATFIQEHGDYRAWLQALNDALRPHELHFGYRVFDEIVAFLISAQHNQLYGKQPEDLAAFDAAVLMKVLPKFHGSRSKLEQSLIEILAWCMDPDTPIKQIITDNLQNSENNDFESLSQLTYKCPRTAERALRMLRALYTTGFAAFG